jgi:hypothetical protein
MEIPMLIRSDKQGLYIRSRGGKSETPYRPGNFVGHSHAHDTTEAGLKAGDNPRTVHVSGAPFVRIHLPNGRIALWGSYGREAGDFHEGEQEERAMPASNLNEVVIGAGQTIDFRYGEADPSSPDFAPRSLGTMGCAQNISRRMLIEALRTAVDETGSTDGVLDVMRKFGWIQEVPDATPFNLAPFCFAEALERRERSKA